MSTATRPAKLRLRPPLWKVWLVALRPHTLTASLSPVIVGHHLTQSYPLQPLTLPWLLFCVLIQLGTNLHNDYADFVKGADTHERVGQARATQKGWLSPDDVRRASTLCLAVASAVFLHLMKSLQQWNNTLLWFILLTSVFNAVAYTGGPYPLGYIGLQHVSIGYAGLGDVFVFLYFGLVAVLTVPYLEVLENSVVGSMEDVWLNWDTNKLVWTTVPVGWLGTAIIVVNNLRDRHTDVTAGKKTLAVRFGAAFCRVEYTLLVVSSYIVLLGLVPIYDSYLVLLPLLSMPIAIHHIRAMYTKEGRDLNAHVGGTALLQLAYCILLCAGLRLSKSP